MVFAIERHKTGPSHSRKGIPSAHMHWDSIY
eukprot:COSAG02_NODE_23645_length_712_cov_0.929853_2_plen_30_part_01